MSTGDSDDDIYQAHKLPQVFPEPMSTPLIDQDFIEILDFAKGVGGDAADTIRLLVAECRRLIVKEKYATREFSDELAENIRLRRIIEASASGGPDL